MRATIIALAVYTAASANAVTLEERMPTCLACHGENGQSQKPEVPSLGAQTSPYALIQLYLFREKQRVQEVMNAMAADLSDDDLQTFADAIAKLPPPRVVETPNDAARLANGLALVQKYRCNFCHTASLAGRDNIPRIASQREDFLRKTLHEYKTNVRHGYDGSMAEVLQPVGDTEIDDLAYAISRQP